MAQNYELLSRFYDLDWSYFALQYASFVKHLATARGMANARVLDLACGTGILAVELAREGHKVTGLDKSPQMIQKAREKARGLPNARFTVDDMTSFTAPPGFHLVTCTFDSINYLLSEEQVSTMFSQVAGVLRDDGVFVFDSVTGQFFREYNHASYNRTLDGVQVSQNLTYQRRKREAVTVFRFGEQSEVHVQRPWDFEELEPLLRREGFGEILPCGDLHGARYGRKTLRLYCIAVKNGQVQVE